MKHSVVLGRVCLVSIVGLTVPALAQRADENAAAEAEDAFGFETGGEAIGLYDTGSVRGFSPSIAGNDRIEGLYFDRRHAFTADLIESTSIHVGQSALGYLFPAPSGVVDYHIRRAGNDGEGAATVGLGAFVSPFASVQRTQRASEALAFTGGITIFPDYNTGVGSDTRYLSIAGAVEYQPVNPIGLTSFSNIEWYDRSDPRPFFFRAEGVPPPRLERNKTLSPEWAEGHGVYGTWGLIGDWRLNEAWLIKGGAFHSFNNAEKRFSYFVSEIDAQGIGDPTLIAHPDSLERSFSGDLQIRRRIEAGAVEGGVILSVRGRNLHARHGGEDIIDLGTGPVSRRSLAPEPLFEFTEQSIDEVDQAYAGGQADFTFIKRLRIITGAQQVFYRKSSKRPGNVATSVKTEELVYNAAVALVLTPVLSMYGAITKGMEESGVAPANAANRNDLLPAVISKQKEIGVKWTWGEVLTANVGVFDLAKPFAGLDVDGTFTFVGDIKNRGFEVSIASNPAPGLTILAGGVFLDPALVGTGLPEGARSVGTVRDKGIFVLNYEMPWVHGLSVDATVSAFGGAPANQENTIRVDGYTLFDLGLRWAPVWLEKTTMRIRGINLFNESALHVGASEDIQYQTGRTFTLAVTHAF